MWGGATVTGREHTCSVFLSNLFVRLQGWCKTTTIFFFKNPNCGLHVPDVSDLLSTAQRKGRRGREAGQKARANCPKERKIRVSTKETWLKGEMHFQAWKSLSILRNSINKNTEQLPAQSFFHYLCTCICALPQELWKTELSAAPQVIKRMKYCCQ